MTYGFRPRGWPAFEHELRVRGIAVTDIERVEIRPHTTEGGDTGAIVTVVLRSGRVDRWTQQTMAAVE